jgi:catechol 2,3-dioxygenase-like lactoylglutathione lyase family enzyme
MKMEENEMIDGITIGDISIDCTEPEKLRGFYAELTGWETLTLWNCPALISDNKLVLLFMPCDFDYIPPVWPEEPGQQQKQMHFNFQVDDLSSAVREAIALGATKPESQYGGDDFVSFLDPEGHPFCLCQK